MVELTEIQTNRDADNLSAMADRGARMDVVDGRRVRIHQWAIAGAAHSPWDQGPAANQRAGALRYLEDLASASEFLFVCLMLRLYGASGSMVRPVAIV